MLQSLCLSYADHLKIMGIFERQSSISLELQQDLDVLCEWSNIWSMELNLSKCKAMYLGGNRSKCGYVMMDSAGSHTLSETSQEKDLGVFISNDLNGTSNVPRQPQKQTVFLAK